MRTQVLKEQTDFDAVFVKPKVLKDKGTKPVKGKVVFVVSLKHPEPFLLVLTAAVWRHLYRH